MSPYQLKPGTVLQNRYLIGSVLGEGGFGITYIGLDKVLAKRVAVKEFYPAGAAHRASVVSGDVIITRGKEPMYRRGVERFVQEARSLAAFSSEDGIVDVLDTFQANNTAYIVMEYLEGNTLKALLKTEGVFDAARLIKLMEPVMKSLSVMHRTGFIHRDISPDNIMLTNNGKLKLMDFGSARYFLNQDSELSVMLKQGYAPVEQYSSRSQQGPYTDVYALCATIYTCITGTVPENSLDRSRYDTLVPPSAKGVRISPVHEKALLHGLQPNAAVRSPDMETLMREFNGTVDPNRTQNAEVETNKGGGYIPPGPPEPPDTPPKNNTPIVVALVVATVAVLIVCGILLFMLLKDNGGDDTETGTSTLASESTAMTVSSVETTVEPTTIIPTTIEPTTVVPTTIVPTTIVPTTIVPTPQPTSPPPPPQPVIRTDAANIRDPATARNFFMSFSSFIKFNFTKLFSHSNRSEWAQNFCTTDTLTILQLEKRFKNYLPCGLRQSRKQNHFSDSRKKEKHIMYCSIHSAIHDVFYTLLRQL